ncbi:S-type Pyocin [Vibrio ruber DSM 16370]|uniref:S-type Pyocin n=1 Tax=Vibrio ruber (strain DSM 16370 / JCM 11486 / BCRC 17186 / CECT 7878 / LMG 23124 / VR1) TaxID=1123498 RepID=A0A1R4LGE6_VIBR1|nr:S-type pyocin domain-containing protein [Vibrio ruber]SJN55509.1 S-type Pyocin [Vibrio ruber DSM 16370]
MNYQTTQIYNLMRYEFAQVEGDFSSLRESDIKSVMSAGMRFADFLEQLRSGHQVLLTDVPSIPLLIRDRDEWGNQYWRVNPEVEPHLDLLANKAYTARVEWVNHGIGSTYSGCVNASVSTEPYVEREPEKLSLQQRLFRQRQERLRELDKIQLPSSAWQNIFNKSAAKPSRFAKSALVPSGTCDIGTQRESLSALGDYAAYTLAVGQGISTVSEEAFLTRIGGAALAELPGLALKIVGRIGILAAFVPNKLADSTLYSAADMRNKDTVETNIRLGFNTKGRIYGYHVNGADIPKREVKRVGDKFVVELEPDITIEWVPISGDFGGKPILVNPIPEMEKFDIWIHPQADQGQEFDNTYITPIADADLQDYILTFPAEIGLPPLYVVYSHQIREPNGQFGASKYPKPELNRTSLRAETKRQIEEEAFKDANGHFTDSDGNVLTDWHYGHRYGLENRRILRAADQMGMTQEELNDFVNAHPDYFVIEDAKTNLSHVNEKPDSDDLRKILREMRIFLKNRNT